MSIRNSSNAPLLRLAAGLLTVSVAGSLGGCVEAAVVTDDVDQATSAVAGTREFTGTIDADAWVRTPFWVAANRRLELDLDWERAAANLNVFLYDPDGVMIAHASSAAKPERVSFTTTKAGSYSFGIKCTGAKTRYTAQVRVASEVETIFGESLDSHGTPAENVEYALQRFGRIPAARIYLGEHETRLPTQWSDSPHLSTLPAGTDVVLSFKPDGYGVNPADAMIRIANGAADADLRSLLASRPSGTRVWISLYHEPEDQIEQGAFSLAQYRAAWSHLGSVVHSLHEPGVRSALILLHWTLNPLSHRDWHDYYVAGAADMISWDVYNGGQKRDVPFYVDPAGLIASIVEVADQSKTTWAISELGTPIITGDDGTGRATWLRGIADPTLADGRAEFVTYWDRQALKSTVDFTLDDPASIAVWRALSAH